MVGPIMSDSAVTSETIDLLQELGLKEYEARCFLALTQLDAGTAKEISDISEVPRTRVYDATRVLEAKGLVEVQHSNPQQFRAVSITEATTTLRKQYEDRIDTLQSRLESIEPHRDSGSDERLQEVWSLSGHDAIGARMDRLISDGDDEIVLIVVDASILTDRLYESLRSALDRNVTVLIGGITEAIRGDVADNLPRAEVFESDLPWLVEDGDGAAGTAVGIGRLLLVDRTSVLVSSFYPDAGSDDHTERAVFATGLGNGIVVLIRRMIATGLLPARDPAR